MTLLTPTVTARVTSTADAPNFGEVAELYDLVRPGYPLGLLTSMLDYAQVGPGDTALEIGAGTGQAPLRIANAGLAVTALEPSPELAAIANRNFAAAGLTAQAVVTTFE